MKVIIAGILLVAVFEGTFSGLVVDNLKFDVDDYSVPEPFKFEVNDNLSEDFDKSDNDSTSEVDYEENKEETELPSGQDAEKLFPYGLEMALVEELGIEDNKAVEPTYSEDQEEFKC